MRDEFTQTPYWEETGTEPFIGMEFADNCEPRCACVLLLDTSGSMNGEAIAALSQGLQQFATELRQDRLAAKRVDVAVIGFGDRVDILAEFGSAQNFYPQSLKAKGGTPMGEAINLGIDLLATRQAEYRNNGITPYRPWMFLISDGAPTDKWDRAARRIREGEERKSFSFFAVGVDGADMNTLGQISVKTPLMLRGLAFSEMFRWLSSSLSSVSRSSTGQQVLLANPTGPAGWASID
ncbi:VWA domain-containing protein [Sphingobium sp. WCS2017Hpa-17]|uniref:vWA domain-containing protein n=1 Tax=Sphingobium sp. WCS2017Hpa-17 TaxID=3073638 RepID=UPI00288A9E8D|nr:VWA domain-containing protein [Sphingobium sp. WCS2017Hpa-17]